MLNSVTAINGSFEFCKSVDMDESNFMRPSIVADDIVVVDRGNITVCPYEG